MDDFSAGATARARHLTGLPLPARRRGIAMVRVSKEREGMISPENQRYAIEQYADRANIEIIEWVEGIDESGSRKKSAWWARIDASIARVEAKDADVLIFWRIDRAARNRLKWAIATDRVESAGGAIESATEPNDQSPAGRFGRGMMAEHAAFMAESIGATWKETLERRVRHGLTPNGQRHYGYAYSRAEGYCIDEVEGPKLAAMYRAYTAGDSARDIAARYTDPAATPGPTGAYAPYARWNTASVLRVLDSGFGAGLIAFRGELVPGAHPAVISEHEWTRYLHARSARRRRPRAERSPYVYSGMLFCHCGSKMGGRTDHGRPRYACIRSVQYDRHDDASLAAHVIDDAVLSWLQQFRDELNAAKGPPKRPRPVADPARAIEKKIAALTERLDSATLKYVDGDIPKDAYERVRERLDAERQHLDVELTRARAQQTVRPVAFVGDLLSRWPELPVERRREALRLLVDRIEIGPLTAPERVAIHSSIARS